MAEASTSHLPAPEDERALWVVDLSGYVFRAYHALPELSSSKGEPTHAVHGVASMLHKLIDDNKPARIVAAVDAPGPSFRKERYAQYKANRPSAPPDLKQQLGRVREVVDALRIPAVERARFEADDVIATLVRRARAEDLKVVVVSADKDLLQLVGDGVVMWDTMRDKVYGPAETEKKMGVPPGKLRDLLALTGDSSDNVPGVPSIGPKTAAKLLGEHGDLDGIYAHLDDIQRKSWREKLAAHEDDARTSRELVTLRDDVDVELDPGHVRWAGPDVARLRRLYTELELTRLLSQLGASRAPEPGGKPGRYEVAASLDEVRRAAEAARAAGRLALFPALTDEDALRGRLVGLAISSEEEAGVYVPLAHRYLGAPEQPAIEAVIDQLRPLLEDGELPKVSADLKRDEVALSRLGIELRGGCFDTMLASYLLEAGRHAHGLDEVARSELGIELTSYDQVTDKQRGSRTPLDEVEVDRACAWAAHRADAALRAGRVLGERVEVEGFGDLLTDLELPLARVLAKMERTGIRLDEARLAAIGAEVDQKLDLLERRCTLLAGREFNVASPRQLETILFDELKLPVIKRTKTARSTDHEVLEELATEHELPAAIVEHRQLAKLKGTYLDALPRQVDEHSGRIHTRFNQAVAATGRLSSSEPNLQNIPIRTDIGRQIRTAFVAEPGWEVLAADYSQIELRVLAHLSGDPELTDAYQSGADVHVRTATALFGVKPDAVTREMRGQAKTVNFAVIYGQTQFALARNLGITRREAKRYIDAFFARYAGVARFLEETVEHARETGEVRTLMGRRRLMPDLHSRNRQLRAGAERIAKNTPVQGSAADIMKRAMVDIHRELASRGLRSRMLLTVHDELVLEVPPAEKDAVGPLVRERMEGAMELSVPLAVDIGWGPSWGEAH